MVYDAIVKAKVLYGLESAHLTIRWLRKLDAFQLRGLRQILRMVTTFVDRRMTNAEVFKRAGRGTTKDPKFKKVEKFSECHDRRRIKYAGHLLRAADDNPGRYCTYEPGTAKPWKSKVRRVGRPRIPWAVATHARAWTQIRRTVGEPDSPPDHENEGQTTWVHLLAMTRDI